MLAAKQPSSLHMGSACDFRPESFCRLAKKKRTLAYFERMVHK
jgi:hypothetical protein